MTEGATSLIGLQGTLTVATRGRDGPGEVRLRTEGRGERYRAWSDAPIARGEVVVVYEVRGVRELSVTAMNESEV